MGIKERFMRFMQGRYGTDAFSRSLLGMAMVCLVCSMFTRGVPRALFYWGSLLGLVYCYFRMFSRNHIKRYEENRRFLTQTAGIRRFFARQKSLMAQRRTHRIYSCPSCRQKIRVPKGHGRIEISCPKCHTRFIKRS